MARNYKWTGYLSWSEERMAAAIEDVMKGKFNKKKAAAFHKVPETTLRNKIDKAEREGLSSLEAAQKKTLLNKIKKAKKEDPSSLEAAQKKTFSDAQEKEFVKQILLLKERLFDLTSTDIRKLAFEFAEENNIPHTFDKEKERAGQQWLYSFLSRHKQLSQNNFEETSPASAMGSNRTADQSFFNLLESVYNKYKFLPNDIYNVNETGIIIIKSNKSSKVLALREEKQVNSLSSSVVLITAETCMNAAGDYMPTMFIFPKKEVSHVLMDDAPRDSFAVYHKSGFIQKNSFINWFNKFIKFSRPQPEKPVLLLLNGHASHTKSVEFIKLAQENNVIILPFPPHYPHWLQPLDVSFIPPLITYYEQEVQKWQNHYRRDVSIHKVETLYKKAFSRAAQRQTAIEGFKKSGIYPLNRDVFADHPHAPSKTTEKPMQ